jgi:hypothetical protein
MTQVDDCEGEAGAGMPSRDGEGRGEACLALVHGLIELLGEGARSQGRENGADSTPRQADGPLVQIRAGSADLRLAPIPVS